MMLIRLLMKLNHGTPYTLLCWRDIVFSYMLENGHAAVAIRSVASNEYGNKSHEQVLENHLLWKKVSIIRSVCQQRYGSYGETP